MSGFVVKAARRPPNSRPAPTRTAIYTHPTIEICDTGVHQVATASDSLALIDGYALGVSAEQLATILEAHDDAALSRIHGNFCALIIRPDGTMEGHCDRFGARTLYWQQSDHDGLVIASRWNSMPVPSINWDALGLGETLRYRWMSGQHTSLEQIYKLPHWQRVVFADHGEITIHDSDQAPKWPPEFEAVPIEDKISETRQALDQSLCDVASSYDNAAIFLSGGVDSSLLAALSKPHFKKCLLVTPVFPGSHNPELDYARSFARTLQLEHLLVEFDPGQLDQDLKQLIRLKGGQVTFQSVAFHQLMRAIPDEYQLVIHGEAADTLFGMGPISKTQTYLKWKDYTDLAPNFLLALMARLPYRRLQSLLRKLRSSRLDLTLQHFQIQYDRQAMRIIEGLYDADLDSLYAHQLVAARPTTDYIDLRRLLQQINLKCSVANHFRELDVSASCFNKHFFAPFLSEPVISAAKTLTREQYFSNKAAKPVLRELACEHFEREMIYSRKRGFEVPFIEWLHGPLAHLVRNVLDERRLFDGRALSGLSIERQFSLYWSLINWQVLNNELGAIS